MVVHTEKSYMRVLVATRKWKGKCLPGSRAVALVEASERPVFSAITGLSTGKSTDAGAFRMGAVDVFPLRKRQIVPTLP